MAIYRETWIPRCEQWGILSMELNSVLSWSAISIRSPEPSKTSVLGSSEDAIEPVSPPEGMTEPGHARSAAYPLLYRDGEQGEPRYPWHKSLLRGDGVSSMDTHGLSPLVWRPLITSHLSGLIDLQGVSVTASVCLASMCLGSQPELCPIFYRMLQIRDLTKLDPTW